MQKILGLKDWVMGFFFWCFDAQIYQYIVYERPGANALIGLHDQNGI